RRLEVVQEARRQLSARTAESLSVFESDATLADELARPRREYEFVIDKLHTHNGNALLLAQRKAGKTTTGGNVTKALADRQPFCDYFDVRPLDGRIAYWNYELDAEMWVDWMRAVGIANPDRISPLHLRGVQLPIWIDAYAERAVDWLRRHEIEYW